MTELDFGPEARARWVPPAEELRRLGHAVVDLLVEHLAGDDAARAFKPYPNERARAMLAEPLPEHGEDADAVLARLAADVLPYPFGNGHPRFAGWVNGPPVPLARARGGARRRHEPERGRRQPRAPPTSSTRCCTG